MSTPRFLLHHAPRSRSGRILWLLEEAGLPFELHVHDLQKGTHKEAPLTDKNPHGKVPTLIDRGPDGSWSTVVTESAAICLHVADQALAAGTARIAPPLHAKERGAYLTWAVYTPAVLEPAFTDLVSPRTAPPPASSIGWPTIDEALARVEATLKAGPFLLGEAFSAADIMVGGMLNWLSMWKKIPADHPVFAPYLAALLERPANQRARARDAEILAAREAAGA